MRITPSCIHSLPPPSRILAYDPFASSRHMLRRETRLLVSIFGRRPHSHEVDNSDNRNAQDDGRFLPIVER